MVTTQTASADKASRGLPASPPRDDLFRAVLPGAKLRDDGKPTMYGHFAVFEEWAEIDSLYEGHFLERVSAGAFSKTISENRQNMRVLFHHGQDKLGLQVLGEIEDLREDEHGAYYEVGLFEGIPTLIMDGLRAGQYGSSYRFRILQDEYVQRPKRSAYNPRGIPERTILEVKVREFGPTPFPAFAGATSGVRSMTDEFFVERLAQDPERFEALVSGMRGRSLSLNGLREVTPERPEREYKRTLEHIGEAVWAITPTMLATIVAIVGERVSGYKPTEEEIRERIGTRDAAETPATGSVAVIEIHGPITPRAGMFTDVSGGASVEQIQQELRAALADPAIESIVFDIDSPGGEAQMIPELGAEIMAARGQKPMTAVANPMAASGAYWIACCADELVVTPSGDVGSIGVYSAHQDMSAMQEKLGVKTTLVSAGEYKTERNPFEPLTDDAHAEMQQRVDAIHTMFIDAVAAGRDVPVDTVRSDFGRGRVVMAPKAVELGMADRVATFDETLAQLQQQSAATRAEEQEQTTAEPEPSEATTRPPEPEPSEATTPTAPPIRSAAQLGAEEAPSWHL